MNTKKSLLALSIATAAAFSSMSHAADNPWYVGISINQADLSDVDTLSTAAVANVTRRIDIDTDSETGFGLTLGRTLFTASNGNTLSAELNYSNSDHDVENLRFMNNNFLASEGRSEGSVDVETILARLTYKFDLGSFNPYVGIGLGQSDLEVDVRYGGSVGQPRGARPPFATGGDSATAFELRAGVEYELSDNFGIFLEYTSTDVSDIEFSRTGGGPGGLATTEQSGDYDIDSFNLGLNYRF